MIAHPVGAVGAHAEELRVMDILEAHLAPLIYIMLRWFLVTLTHQRVQQ